VKKIFFSAIFLLLIVLQSCKERNAGTSNGFINELNLKRGEVISCGAQDKQFGMMEFEASLNENVKDDFTLAVKLLHSFEYDEAEKAFAKVIDKEPGCAIAYWGVAMSNFHAL
jgi:hypothetical protein